MRAKLKTTPAYRSGCSLLQSHASLFLIRDPDMRSTFLDPDGSPRRLESVLLFAAENNRSDHIDDKKSKPVFWDTCSDLRVRNASLFAVRTIVEVQE